MAKFEKVIDDEIIGVEGQAELDCVACSTVTRETWENHVQKSSHIVAHKRFDLIFDIVEDGVRCKFCNVDLSRDACKEHTKIHYMIPWDKVEEQYDRYEIFFGNSILEWKNSFHCRLCDVTCLEWSTALVHITNAKHQTLRNQSTRAFDNLAEITENDVSYRLLVNEGLLARSGASVECVFCKSQNVSIRSVVRHVRGLAHICNRAKFALVANVEPDSVTSESPKNGEYRTREWVNESCKEEMKNPSSNNHETDDHVSNESSSPLSDPEESSVRQRYGNFIEPTDASSEGTSGDAIAESEDSDDVDGDSLDCRDIWILPINDTHSYCVICNLSFSSSPAHKSIHLSGRFHENSRKLNGCDDIEMRRTGEYHCRCCDEEFQSPEDVHLHVGTSRHSNLSNRRVAEAPFAGSEREIFRQTPKHLPSYYVVKVGADSFRCVICDLDVLFTSKSVNEHVEGKLHAASSNRYGCRSILRISHTGYYCGHCNLKIGSCEKLYDHIKGAAHLSALQVADPKRSTLGIAPRGCLPRPMEQSSLRRPVKGASKPKKIPRSLDEANSKPSKEEILLSKGIEPIRSKEEIPLSKGIEPIRSKEEIPLSGANSNRSKEKIPLSKVIEPIRSKEKIPLSKGIEPIRSKEKIPSSKGIEPIRSKERIPLSKDIEPIRSKEKIPLSKGIEPIRSKEKIPLSQGIEPIRSKGKIPLSKGIEPIRPKEKKPLSKGIEPIRSKEEIPLSEANSNRSKEKIPLSKGIKPIRSKEEIPLSEANSNRSKEKIPLSKGIEPIRSKEEILLREANSNRSKEKTPSSEDIEKLRRDFIVELSDASFRCVLCDCRVSPSSGSFDDHVGQLAHREAINVYGCDRIIFEEGDTYYCERCNVDFSDFEAVCRHVKESEHVESLSASTSSMNNNINDRQDYWPERKDYYVTVSNDLTAYCQICECSLSSSVRNISHHTMGKPHAKSLRKYGCEYIIQANDRSYYCKCCDAPIDDLENVFLHVKASSHCDSAKKSEVTKNIDTCSTTKTEISRTKNFAQRRLEDIINDNARHPRSTETLEKLNSNDIVLLGDNKYYCNYCSCMICGYEGMNLHSRGKKHLTTKSLHLLKDSLRDGRTQ